MERLTAGSSLSIFSSMVSSSDRGRMRWSYSIMQDLTPGLVSMMPGVFCVVRTGTQTHVPGLSNTVRALDECPGRIASVQQLTCLSGHSSIGATTGTAGVRILAWSHLLLQNLLQLVHADPQIDVQLHRPVLNKHISASTGTRLLCAKLSYRYIPHAVTCSACMPHLQPDPPAE